MAAEAGGGDEDAPREGEDRARGAAFIAEGSANVVLVFRRSYKIGAGARQARDCSLLEARAGSPLEACACPSTEGAVATPSCSISDMRFQSVHCSAILSPSIRKIDVPETVALRLVGCMPRNWPL